MATALHLDPYAGISVAATLGALLDLGLPLEQLRNELRQIPVNTPWSLTAERATAGVTGTRIIITTDRTTPLTLGEAEALLAESDLPSSVRQAGRAIVQRIAAATWGTPRASDPAGTLDTLLALIGVLVGLELLAVTEVSMTAPPQAVAGSPVTPAAQALLATIAVERPAALRLQQVGYGLGPADPNGPHPVAVRVWLGEATAGATTWQTLIAPATVNDAVPGALLLVLDHASEAGADHARLAALAAAWSGVPATLCALAGGQETGSPQRLTAALEAAVTSGAQRIVVQSLQLLTQPEQDETLNGIVRWASSRWPERQIVLANPLLTAKQLAYRLTGRATTAAQATEPAPPAATTALLLVAPGSTDVQANAEAYRLARLVWEGQPWATCEVAFLNHTSPTVATGLQRCQQLGAQCVIVLPVCAMTGPSSDACTTAIQAATPALPCLLAQPPGTAEGFAAIVWERYREASGLPTGDAAHGHAHAGSSFHPILPPRYQGDATVNSSPMPGAADLVFDDTGQVAWDTIWGEFCDLAIAGGPPHRGELLEAPSRAEVLADPAGYDQVLEELTRGLRLITGWPIIRDAYPGWIGVVCPNEEAVVWLLRAVLTENVVARREGVTLFLPAGPAFRLKYEIKNVITAMAKTHHYWTEHQAVLLAAQPPAAAPEPAIISTDPAVADRNARRYEYECPACQTRFDLVRPLAEAGAATACPFCGGAAKRVYSAPKLLFKADPRDSQPVWHNHGGYGHAHAPGKGFHGAQRPGTDPPRR